jgi:hypothetical protein
MAAQNGTRYIACVLSQLAAPGFDWNFNPGAAGLILNKLNEKCITLVSLY